jgi:predicted DNA-binding transcriptional regulator YafY
LVTLQLIPNYELETALLALGEGVEVLSPKALRDRIKERVKATAARYK